MASKIIKCNCKNDFQDKKYGRNNRVANKTQKSKGQNSTKFRCTVCNTEV